MYGVIPFCGGKLQGLETVPLSEVRTPRLYERLPRSLGRSMRNEGVSDLFPQRKRESQTLFSHRKRGNLEHPQIPLAKIALAQRMKQFHLASHCVILTATLKLYLFLFSLHCIKIPEANLNLQYITLRLPSSSK